MGAAVLVADDEPGIRDLLRWELGEAGYEVTAVSDGEQAIDALRRAEFAVAVFDVRMPGRGGIELLAASRELSPDCEVIIATGYADLDTAIACVHGGAFELVLKPFETKDLLAMIRRALERRELRAVTALYRASQAIFAVREPRRLPEVIVAAAATAAEADAAALLTPNGEGSLHAVAVHGPMDDDTLREAEQGGTSCRRALVLPLASGDRSLGALVVSRANAARPFRRPCIERATVVAAQASLALDNAQLLHKVASTERLAAIGELAAGVAHEVSNPVACVLSAHAYLRECLGALEPALLFAAGPEVLAELRGALADADEGATRIKEIAGDLRSLARSGDDKELFDLNDAVRAAIRISAAAIRYHARVEARLGDDVHVRGSRGRLTQVFVNLLVNAGHAIQALGRSDGRVMVATSRSGDRVIAHVTDDGCGIPPEHLPRIFEPFFTTKGPSSGTGLGLPISRDIVRRHGGEIKVVSTGAGTTFTVELPTSEAQR